MARDWQKYLSEDDRRALDSFAPEVAQPRLGGPGGEMSIAARPAGRSRSPVDAIGPEEEKALAMLSKGDMFAEPDLGGPQGVPTSQPGTSPQQPSGAPSQVGGTPRNAGAQLDAPSPFPQDTGARLDAPQAPPSQQPRGAPGAGGEGAIAAAREKGGDRAQALMALSAIGRLFGGGGGAAERTEQQAFSERDRLVNLAQQKVARERAQEQQQFQRRMAEEGLDVRRQQVEGTQQVREAQARAKQMEAQREQAMRDPASDVSRRAQMAVKKTFGDAIPDEVLQQMSAEELQSSGNPVMAAAKKARSMQMENEQFEQRREAKLEDYKTKRETAFPYDMAIARAKANVQADKYAQELAMRTEVQKDMEEMKAEERMGRKMRDEVKEYAKLATKTELPSQMRLVDKARKLAREMEQETGEIFGPQDEIVRKLAPEARGLMTQKAAELQMILDQLMNMTLKDRSGAAVTASEMQRLKAELGQGLTGGEDALKNALDNTYDYLQGRHRDLMGGFAPEVMDQYRQNYESAVKRSREKVKEEQRKSGQPVPEDEPEERQQSSAQPQGGDTGGEVKVRYTTPDGSRTLTMPRDDAAELRRRVQGREGYGAEVLE